MTSNLPATTPLTPEEISAILAGAGAIDSKDEGYGAIRMKVTGNTFQTADDVWLSSPKAGAAPAFTARLMSPPEQYQAYWFDAADAATAGRPDMADRFCKSYYDNPQEAREYGTNGASCRACPFHPFTRQPKKCSWRGDLRFQMVPEDGVLTGDEPLYEVSLSTTGMIEFRGTKRDPGAGSVSPKNFMVKLAELSISMADEWGVDPQAAVLIGLEALNEGLVAAEFRILIGVNEERGQSWSVVSLTPVHVQRPEVTSVPAIEDGAGASETDAYAPDDPPASPVGPSEDDLPFK